MPSASTVFRAVCGSFHPVYMAFMFKRAREKAASRIAMLTPRTRTDGVTLGLLLSLMFWGSLLLRCGDVERNPGPPPEDKLRRTRLGSGRKTSMDRTGSTADGSQATSPDQPSLTELKEMMQSMNSNMQTMNHDMNCKFNDVEKGLKDLTEQYAALHKEVKDLRGEVGSLKKENADLVKSYSELLAKVENLDRKADDLEGRSKRNNLILYGVFRDRNESNEQCEEKLQDLISDKLEIAKDINFDHVHRLNDQPNSPIIARCSFYKDKVRVLKAKRNLKGSDIFIGEDFSFRVREIRRKLSPHLKEARKEGKKATMIFDHLVIDGQRYFLGDHDQLKEHT
eukprot:TRINITY_DN4177_c0_g2_i1.p1 TRINITY_DN4177_c0_g2~~TRINITY_DN4177_c0_g2_i1.p1  ORF type:complete len:339 (+),score=59.47 TRINITY_DN4177_c0_g2_i1:148-1164(+)